MNRTLAFLAASAAFLSSHCSQVATEAPPVAGWSTVQVTETPTARHETAMVATGNKAYLMGGRGVKPVEEFDPVARTWRKLGPTPMELHHFQPVAYEGRIFVMTAMTGKYPKETPLETIYIYDPETDAWEQGPEIPPSRRRGGAGTVVYGGKIYLACGIIDGHTSGTVAWFDEFDPQTAEWRQLPDAPHARDHFSAVVSHDRLYLIGGRDTSYHEPDNFTAFFDRVVPEVDVYDFATQQWATLPAKLPVGTAAGGLIAMDRSIYYFGGETAQDLAHAETQRLDLDTGEWSMVAPLVRGRHGGGAAAMNGEIYFATGSGGRGGGPELSTTEVFRP